MISLILNKELMTIEPLATRDNTTKCKRFQLNFPLMRKVKFKIELQ